MKIIKNAFSKIIYSQRIFSALLIIINIKKSKILVENI